MIGIYSPRCLVVGSKPDDIRIIAMNTVKGQDISLDKIYDLFPERGGVGQGSAYSHDKLLWKSYDKRRVRMRFNWKYVCVAKRS